MSNPEPSDWCRHCLRDDVAMTLEHLPPRSAGNSSPVRERSDAEQILREFNEGHALPVLCDSCNGGASDRGLTNAYKLWRLEVIDAIETHTHRESGGRPYNVWRTESVVQVEHGYNLHPGRIARQLLGMLLAIQDNSQLASEHPALRETYFSEDTASIAPMRLFVALANTNYRYFTDALAAIRLDLKTGSSVSATMRLWSFSPFVAVLIEDGSDAPFPSLEVGDWLGHPTTHHFRKSDRSVGYPVAPRFDPLVAMLYGNSEY